MVCHAVCFAEKRALGVALRSREEVKRGFAVQGISGRGMSCAIICFGGWWVKWCWGFGAQNSGKEESMRLLHLELELEEEASGIRGRFV